MRKSKQSLISCLKKLKRLRPKKEHKIINKLIMDVEFYSTWPLDLTDVPL